MLEVQALRYDYAGGIEALRAALQVQMIPEDVSRFLAA